MEFQEHTNSETVFRARNNLCPGNVQGMISERELGFNLRCKIHFKNPSIQSNVINK